MTVDKNMTSVLKTLTNEFSDTSSQGKADLAKFLQIVLGYVADASQQMRLAAWHVHIFNSESQPFDALEIIGRQRNIPRYAGMSDDQYANNLYDAWNVWARAGTPRGIEQQVRLMGLNGRVTDDHMNTGVYPSMAAFPSQSNLVINIDGTIQQWDTGLLWDSGLTWDNRAVVDFPTDDQITSSKQIIKLFKDFKWTFREIIVEVNSAAIARYEV